MESIERLVRQRAVAPLDPSLPPLPPGQRRSWWQFCLEMYDFLGGILRSRAVDWNQGQHLARLQWLCLRATYVFGTADPALRGEQRRYMQLGGCLAAAFAIIVDDEEGTRDLCRDVFGGNRFWSRPDRTPKEPAEAEALVGENFLRRWANWEDAGSPIGWVKKRAWEVHEREHACGGVISKTDALYSTPKRIRDRGGEPAVKDGGPVREVIPLEEISEYPGIATVDLQPRYTRRSVQELEAAIREDEDLRSYAHLRHTGWKRRAAWVHLGWETGHGEAVDRRYRRFLEKIRSTGFEYADRDIEVPEGMSDASCKVVKERLRIPVPRSWDSTLSGRVVYEPLMPGRRTRANSLKTSLKKNCQ